MRFQVAGRTAYLLGFVRRGRRDRNAAVIIAVIIGKFAAAEVPGGIVN
jgi:hypothetical protein